MKMMMLVIRMMIILFMIMTMVMNDEEYDDEDEMPVRVLSSCHLLSASVLTIRLSIYLSIYL